MSESASDPGGHIDAMTVDVTDADDLRSALLRVIDDCEANDLDTMETRVVGLLSDVRAAQAADAKRGGD